MDSKIQQTDGLASGLLLRQALLLQNLLIGSFPLVLGRFENLLLHSALELWGHVLSLQCLEQSLVHQNLALLLFIESYFFQLFLVFSNVLADLICRSASLGQGWVLTSMASELLGNHLTTL